MNTQSENEDKALIKKVALGDPKALDKLHRKHSARVETFVRWKLHNAPCGLEVSDIVQDVFRRVQLKASLYKPQGRVLSWILKIAQNIIIDLTRQWRSSRKREANYAFARPPQGGEVEGPEECVWEYGDPANGAGGVYGKDLLANDYPGELYVVEMPCEFVIIPRIGGGDNLVWFGDPPLRRVKWVKGNRVRKWMNGAGRDDIRGMFSCYGLAPKGGD
jgi:hypothetical protein